MMTDDVDRFLEEHSSLTKRQIECVAQQISARSMVRDSKKKDRPDVIREVSEGSYYRVLSQAKNNINQAVYTTLLCSRMGLIQAGDLNRLLNLMSNAPSEMTGNSEEVISLVEALVRRIVML
jgi:hypothetical protein